jgi:hypothetical protein
LFFNFCEIHKHFQSDRLATMVGTVKFADDDRYSSDDGFGFVTKSTFELTGREEPFFTKQFRLVTEFGNEHYENWKDSLKEVIDVTTEPIVQNTKSFMGSCESSFGTTLASSTTCSGAGGKGDSAFSMGCGSVNSMPKTWTIQNLEPAKPKRNISVQKENPRKETATMQRLRLKNPMAANISDEKKSDADAVKENKAELERITENVYESITSGRVFLVPMNNTNESAYDDDDQQVKLVHSDDSKDDNICDDDAIDFKERKNLSEPLSGVRNEDIGFDNNRNGCELTKSQPDIGESRDPPPSSNDLKRSQQQHTSFDYSPFEKLSLGNNKNTTTFRRLPMHIKNKTTVKKLLQNHSHKSKDTIGSCFENEIVDEIVDQTVVTSPRVSTRGNYRTRGYNKGMSASKGSNLLSTKDDE